MTGMIGILNAQINIDLASQNHRIANSTISAGRIRERQGEWDGNAKAIEEGQELQARGKEIKAGTFEYLRDAINDINSVAKNHEECEEAEASDENYRDKPASHIGYPPGEFDVVVGDTVTGSRSINVPSPRQSSINIAV